MYRLVLVTTLVLIAMLLAIGDGRAKRGAKFWIENEQEIQLKARDPVNTMLTMGRRRKQARMTKRKENSAALDETELEIALLEALKRDKLDEPTFD